MGMCAISFLAFAAIVVTSALGFDTLGSSSIVEVDNGRALAVALANHLVHSIALTSSVTLNEDDWRNLGELPILLRRDVTIFGSPELVSSGDLPVFNGSFVKNKLKLAGGIMLNLTGVVLTGYREDIPSSTPGLDLLTTSLNTTGPPPLLVWHKIALTSRLCFPKSWSRKSVDATIRPDAIPGVQNVTSDLPQPGCRNELIGPWLTRCYPARREYVDVAAYGAVYGPTGSYERTGYLVHAIDTPLLCSGIMTDECIAKYGVVGCFYSVFPKTKAAADSSASASASSPPKTTSSQQRPSQHRRALVVVLCSVLGGAAVIVAAAIAVLVILRGRRLGRLQGLQAAAATGHGRKKAHEKHRCGGPYESYGTSSDGAGEQPQRPTTCLDMLAPAAGGQLVMGDELRLTAAHVQLEGQQPAVDAGMPVTLMTLPRPDMHLLADPFISTDDNEVKLLPNATRGAGSFGRVVEGVYKGQRVAVKLVADAYHWGGPSESLLRSFAQEVEVLCRCQHPNVVRLLAACLTPPRVCLVMELMEASLEQLMYPQSRKATGTLLPLTTVLHLGLEISKGLEYLHPTIIHRDLKPGNVLLNDPSNARPVVKLADFGLSRLRSTEAPTQTPDAGTPAYLAPEGLDPLNYVITHKADMYSLAIMMWEMVAGERPWLGLNMMEMAVKVTLQGFRPPLERISDARCPPKLRSLIECCWDSDPRRRPAAAEVAKDLALILQELESEGGAGAGVARVAGAGPGGCPRFALGGGYQAAAAGGGGRIAGQVPQCGPDYQDGGDDGAGSGPDGGGRRATRALGRKVSPADVAAAIADVENLVSPETCSRGAARAPDADRADPGGGDGAKPQPPPPSPPEPHECAPQPKPNIIVLRELFGKKTPADASVDPAGGVAPLRLMGQPRPSSQLDDSSDFPYTQYGAPGARVVGCLGSSTMQHWTGTTGTAEAGLLQGGPNAPPPPAAATSIGPSGRNTSPQLHVDGAFNTITNTTKKTLVVALVPTGTR